MSENFEGFLRSSISKAKDKLRSSENPELNSKSKSRVEETKDEDIYLKQESIL
jgi:hypothetical protein